MLRILAAAFICALLVSACNLSISDAPANAVSADSDSTPAPDPDATASPVTLLPTAEATASTAPTLAPSSRCSDDADRPTRSVKASVEIDYGSKVVQVSQRIQFLNSEQSPLSDLVLDVQPNQWEGIFSLTELRVDDLDTDYLLVRNRLEIQLAHALPSGCWLEVALKFKLQAEPITDGLRSYRGFFGYSARQLNLGHFLPAVAARLDGDWLIHEPVGIGEQIVYELADWDVDISVTGADETLQLAAPGRVTLAGKGSWNVQLRGSRDFALSLSEEFVLHEQALGNGVVLAVYTFADALLIDRGLELDGAAHVLREAEKSLETFARLFGDYAWDRLVIVQGDFPDGMEFSGLVFVGSGWFYGYDGTTRNYLTLIAVHEIAHQWWHARVGNDAALHPWLDEALATYSEYLFVEANYPEDKNWWWTFRVAVYYPQGFVDYPVYEFDTPRAYINAAYLRGAQMLQTLRENLGDKSFFDLLRAYYAEGAKLIADPALFWRQIAPEQQPLTEATRREFLSKPAVYASPAPEGQTTQREAEGG